MKSKIKGIAVAETLIVLPIILLLGMGVVHLGLVYQAKTNLEYAALMAARIGATTSIDLQQMRNEVVLRMRPSAIGTSTAADNLQNVTIEILNPDTSAFQDWGGPPSGGAACGGGFGGSCEIPNDNLMNRPTNTGGASGLSIQDANILRIKVTYFYDTRVPFMQAFYLDGRDEDDVPSGVELVAYSTVRMQSPARITPSNAAAFN
ncbi:MAG: TadE/TadG family type IV pilus assembly protein [Ketobacteraceae bacterium]|nr:TadE/TadG family type IV pilus assembly protein [Ketobacteraceae bacterium]